MTGNWYITIAAVRQYMEIAGLSGELETDNPAFAQAEADLIELSYTAKLVESARSDSGALTYRGKVTINGRRMRVECTVMPAERDEGALPQLLRVRLKGPS